MVLGASKYATIYSEGGALLAKHAEAQEREVAEVDGVHLVMTVLLSKGQSSKMTIGITYQIRIGNGQPGDARDRVAQTCSSTKSGDYLLLRMKGENT